MHPRFIQVNCTEGNKIDLRQSEAVLRHKPDIIFLEYSSDSIQPINKPLRISKAVIAKYPWTASDNYMWANIIKLSKAGHPPLVYALDGPHDLVTKANIYPYNDREPRKTTNLFWWVRIYLRELFMAQKLRKILDSYKRKEDPVILVFLQSFHWEDVKFLMSKPSKREIWNFYFRRFKKLTKNEIARLLVKENKILYKYWNKAINPL